jgi:hypothetical protein
MIENMRGRSTETKYGRIPLWLYETGVGLQAIATYGWLHGRYGHYERVMPSYATLAKELGVSRGSVIAYVKALTSVGAVRIETSGAAGRQTNQYVIAFNQPFEVPGQNTDQGGGGQNADRSAECASPSQRADWGGQPVVQEEDVSTKTFFEEDKISLPQLPTQRSEPDPAHEREIPTPIKPSTPQQLLRAANVVTIDEEEAFTAWVVATHKPRSSAWWRTVAANGDLPDLAAQWRATGGRQPLTGTDATVSGWLALADQLAAKDGHQPYRDNVWDDMRHQLASGARPDGWERYPHCGHPACDPVTRGREVEDGSGLKSLTWCTDCHPNMQF